MQNGAKYFARKYGGRHHSLSGGTIRVAGRRCGRLKLQDSGVITRPALATLDLGGKPIDQLFPSSNEWGIPDLDPACQVEGGVPLPVWAWGSVARDREHTGTWHFYVDDKRFSAVLDDPTRVLASGCVACCEPNVSAYDDTPAAMVLWGVYRKRRAAAVWQSAGVRVMVDVNLPASVLERSEWRTGVPDGWRAFSTRGYDRRLASLDDEHAAACRVAFSDRPLFVVVGGGRGVAGWCRGRPGVVHSGYAAERFPYSAAHKQQGRTHGLPPALATLPEHERGAS